MNQNQKLAQWLELRIPYDDRARNIPVEQHCKNHFNNYNKLKIVDLGAGTGANCRYYMSIFPQSQEWVLVEQNMELLEIADERLRAWAINNNYQITAQDSLLLLQDEYHEISIRKNIGSILDIEYFLELESINLTVANAVFDLFSKQQFQFLLECLKKYKIPLLTTTNYSGMHFIPQTEKELLFINDYHRHMQRQQEFGSSMGPDSSNHMWDLINQIGAQVESGKSPWHINSSDPIFMNLLLGFMEEYIPEIITEDRQTMLSHWLDNMKKMVAENKLECVIEHQDFFCNWIQ